MKFHGKLGAMFNPLAWLRQDFSVYILVGILCGSVAVGFHLIVQAIFKLSFSTPTSDFVPWWQYLVYIVVPAFGGLLIGLAIHFFPDAKRGAGSGIPQSKVAYWNDAGQLSYKDAFWRFILSVFSMGSGHSLGREGPTVHLCAAIASQFGQLFKLNDKLFKTMVPVGIGSGVAAAFNTPLAAVTYVIEDILLNDYRHQTIAGVIFAAVIASAVERVVLGANPIFFVHLAPFDTDWWMLLALPIGLVGGLLSHGFVTALLHVRPKIAANRWVADWAKPALAGLLVGLVGCTVFVLSGHLGVFGMGYDDFAYALMGNTVLWVLGLLFVAKIVASFVCVAAGSSGGLIAPSLYIGAMLGGVIGSLFLTVFDVQISVVAGAALIGMGSVFAGIFRVPFTSVLLVYELTGNYSLILPLMFANLIAFSVAEKLRPLPYHESMLMQDGVHLNYTKG